MKISSLFHHRHIAPRWTFTTKGILWRLLFSDTNFIVGEDRDTEKKSVTFFCLNAQNGDALWKDVAYDEAWWIGIEAVVHDRLYLHGFRKPDMPEHSKIIAVDLGTGKVLWQNDRYSFLYATPEKVVAFRDLFEQRIFCELNAASGELVAEMKECPADAYEVKKGNHGRTDFLFPQVLNDDDESMPLRKLIERHTHEEEIRGDIEYVRSNGNVMMNFHVVVKPAVKPNREVLQNRLYVFDERTGEELFSDILNAETLAAVPDSFFVDQSTAYFVKERKILSALEF
jgi:outer membrane protein assembly factor BamB